MSLEVLCIFVAGDLASSFQGKRYKHKEYMYFSFTKAVHAELFEAKGNKWLVGMFSYRSEGCMT